MAWIAFPDRGREREARQLAEFRDSVEEYVKQSTARLDPRLAHQLREFARGLLDLVQEEIGERRPR
ncbi:TPA: hypothetical protein DCY65_01550 [Candidatus Acetothermia bacterium]|nr:hypothetical protein [Candidatus Acetothermia bacterium]HAZ30240.1 hypothetical protein [Candidatus Acetothermia bacterium]